MIIELEYKGGSVYEGTLFFIDYCFKIFYKYRQEVNFVHENNRDIL